MNSTPSNGKKSPPRKAGFQPKPKPTPSERLPKVLFADNELIFLNELSRQHQEDEQASTTLECHTLYLPEEHSADELFFLLCHTLEQVQPDLLVMDIHLKGRTGTDGVTLVKHLRDATLPFAEDTLTLPDLDGSKRDHRRHPWLALPVVLMTQDRYANVAASLETVGEQVEAVIFDKKQDPALLRLVEVGLPSWQQLARERVWSQLERRLAGWLAERNLRHADTALNTLLFLNGHLDMKNCFLRLESPDQPEDLKIIARVNGAWAANKTVLRSQEVPVSAEVLKTPAGFRDSNLPPQLAGIFVPELAHRPFLGARLWYADAAIGLITTVGNDGSDAYTQRDQDHLVALANSLSAVCGRANRQRTVLENAHNYSNGLVACDTETAVAQVLAQMAQKAFQQRGQGWQHESSVRLLEPGTFRLRQEACVLGNDDPLLDADINLDSAQSVIAKVVRTAEPILEGDVTRASVFLRACSWTSSELCVPLQYGGVALGAINLEHESPGYYDLTDQRQLGILANQAALAISRLREHRFASALLDWATEAERLTHTADIWEKIYRSLFEYTGYGCLLHCVPTGGGLADWQVRQVATPDHLQGGIECRPEPWTQEMTGNWLAAEIPDSPSFLRRWLREGIHAVEFVREQRSFQVVTNTALLPREDKANAIIPLLAEGQLKGLLLLFWFHAPPWSDADKAMLARLGRYGGELMAREQRAEEAQKERDELEDLAIYGEVLRQFKHLYRNAKGGLENWDKDILAEAEALARRGADTRRLKEGMEKLLAAIQALPPLERVTAYMHEPKPAKTSPQQAWRKIKAELAAKAERVQASVACDGQDAWTFADPVILELILYMLLDNALDALANWGGNRLVTLLTSATSDMVMLLVQDSGPGVPDVVRASLFERISSSKPDGLGSALLIARRRARAMRGELRLVTTDIGACFELRLPRFAEEANT